MYQSSSEQRLILCKKASVRTQCNGALEFLKGGGAFCDALHYRKAKENRLNNKGRWFQFGVTAFLCMAVFHWRSFGKACGGVSCCRVHPYVRTLGISFRTPCTKYYAHPAPVISRRVSMKVRSGCPCLTISELHVSVSRRCAWWRKQAPFLSNSPHYYTKNIKKCAF